MLDNHLDSASIFPWRTSKYDRNKEETTELKKLGSGRGKNDDDDDDDDRFTGPITHT